MTKYFNLNLTSIDGERYLLGTCQICGELLELRTAEIEVLADHREHPRRCPRCSTELAIRILPGSPTGELVVSARRPYGSADWTDVVSSNLLAAGTVGADLLIRFKGEVVYRYRDRRDLLGPLLAAESKGKYFNAAIKALPCERLCAIYGCSVAVTSPEKHCAAHR